MLTFIAVQLLQVPSKEEFQSILDENSIEKRIEEVSAFLTKELEEKKALAAKREALLRGRNQQEDDEISELVKKIEQLSLPEEAKTLADRELKKLK